MKNLLISLAVVLAISATKAQDISECTTAYTTDLQEGLQKIRGGTDNSAILCPILKKYAKCIIEALSTFGGSRETIETMINQAISGSGVQCDFDPFATTQPPTKMMTTGATMMMKTTMTEGSSGGGGGGETINQEGQECMRALQTELSKLKASAPNMICSALEKSARCMKKAYPNPTEEELTFFQNLLNEQIQQIKATCTVDVRKILQEKQGGDQNGNENGSGSAAILSFWQKMAVAILGLLPLFSRIF